MDIAGRGVLQPLLLTDEAGKRINGVPVKIDVEESGAETVVLKAEGKIEPQFSTVTGIPPRSAMR